jgi:hypothetical protein
MFNFRSKLLACGALAISLLCIAQSVSAQEEDFRVGVFMDDIKKAQEQVDHYTPEGMYWVVSAGANEDQLMLAISKKARAAWLAQWVKTDKTKAEFNAAWDKLAASAATKLPLYKPAADDFKFHFLPGEKMVLGQIKPTATMKVLKIGSDVATWDIEKDGSGFPTYRFKDTYVYVRDSADDFPFCRLYTARVKQDYAGGGRYNTEVYASSTTQEIFGCP